ncbi:hypothetical protein PLICRDRAFT_225711 [Plicaturopsis crispa FD-325 SS-3]|nr:hypothetical protein PLICRDRAFT_225711 [Plicaturopsis crispa FD-325 SS-3]
MVQSSCSRGGLDSDAMWVLIPEKEINMSQKGCCLVLCSPFAASQSPLAITTLPALAQTALQANAQIWKRRRRVADQPRRGQGGTTASPACPFRALCLFTTMSASGISPGI